MGFHDYWRVKRGLDVAYFWSNGASRKDATALIFIMMGENAQVETMTGKEFWDEMDMSPDTKQNHIETPLEEMKGKVEWNRRTDL